MMGCEQNRGAWVRPGSVVAQFCPRDAGGAPRRWQRQSVTGLYPRTRGETLCIFHPSLAHTQVPGRCIWQGRFTCFPGPPRGWRAASCSDSSPNAARCCHLPLFTRRRVCAARPRGGGTRQLPAAPYGDGKGANREIRVWHGATGNGP
jgi:hypothetical protein